MKANNFSINDICKDAYGIFEAHGCAPVYQDAHQLHFVCQVGGAELSFMPVEDEMFWYGAEFKLAQPMSEQERRDVELAYLDTDTDDVAFENLHIEGDTVCLSSAFPCDMYEPELLKTAIRVLESGDGFIGKLRQRG
jgi:hypothetical protein